MLKGLEYFLIDSTAPFFLACDNDKEINWSKVPFSHLEKNNALDDEKCVAIETAFSVYIRRIAAIGYNAVSLDDIAHMTVHSFYPEQLRNKLEAYRRFYSRLVAAATVEGCRIFVTTDILFFNDEIEHRTGNNEKENIQFLCRSLSKLFRNFPAVAGVIVRIGESDGIDVRGDFRSRIVIKTPSQCRRYLKEMLLVCEHFKKQLIVRTWTLGAFPIGDLMWNPRTFQAVFSNLPGENLIISQKLGETDFFRYLTMSPLLFAGNHRRIVEFQARREYEGFGEFPSFVGFDFERYARYLSTCPTLVGISVWCQTGGWSHFRRLTYIVDSSPWVELNVLATIRIFKDSVSAEAVAEEFIAPYCSDTETSLFITLLRLSDKVIKELWYIPEFALQRLYFRRTRVPPLFYIFWDTVIINHSIRKIIRRFVHERHEAIQDGHRCLHRIRRMKKIATQLKLPTEDLDFQYDTFRILYAAREYYFGPWNAKTAQDLQELVNTYRKKYPHGFHIVCDFQPVHFKKWLIKFLFHFALRRHPHYRLIDRLFLLRFSSLVYPLFRLWEKRSLPSFTRNQAMGIEILFK